MNIPTPSESASTSTPEAQAMADILLWSSECCSWQRDALRRLCIGSLGNDDIDELLQICKDNSMSVIPFSSEHIKASTAATTVNLRALCELENINALAKGERLTFEKSGVTVVYGDNGAGKSGYIRVLKKVCRARSPKGENTIMTNILVPAVGSQKATVEFTINGENRQITWTPDSSCDSLLSLVSVFDSRVASIHVDQTNNVAYTPFPMKVLEELAQLCQQLKQRLNNEIQTIQQQTPHTIQNPECRSHTQVGKLLTNLDENTPITAVRILANLSEAEAARFSALKSDLANDPTKTGRILQSKKSRLDETVTNLQTLHAVVTQSSMDSLIRLKKVYEAAREASTTAAEKLFTGEPLPSIGSEVWHTLWKAARAYSEQQAYPSVAFPFTDDGARCVLCQQTLNQEASGRLLRFDEFLKDESKKAALKSLQDYQSFIESLKGNDVPIKDIRANIALLRDELHDESLANMMRKSALTAKWRLRHILRNHGLAVLPPLSPVEPLPIDGLMRHSETMAKRASALLNQGQSEEHKAMVTECDELTDRQWLSIVQEDVVAEVNRKKIIAALKAALKDTNPIRITNKSSDIADNLVTKTLRAQFITEADSLGVAGLALELRKEKSTHGVPLFRVTLIKNPDVKAGDILSEGEFRCVAIAAFLAELSTTESRSALVFDDPVSSLDHMHREKLAERFAAEGEHRQVIVFTHDIAFLFLLNQACHDKNIHIGFRCITRGADFAGFCQQNPPPNAQPVTDVIESMQKQLTNQIIQHQRGEQEAWYKTVRSLQEQLRTTWERSVEEAVAPVIKRLANKVDTKGLSKLTAITIEDCEVMRKAYGRCSALLHSSAEVLNPPLPSPTIIQNEIDALRQWVSDIKKRQDKVAVI